jgi:SAM-dependent methyltransferase
MLSTCSRHALASVAPEAARTLRCFFDKVPEGERAVKLETTEDIVELLGASTAVAVVGTAMELGLFWLLDRQPLSAASAAKALDIPVSRCDAWLQVLCKLGLLEAGADGYAPSAIARKSILSAQSQDTWAFQAREDRDSSLFVQDLALNIGRPMSSWQTRSPASADYFQLVQDDPVYAARLTRKLYQIHGSLAQRVAGMVDLRHVKSVLDLGGGSGVISFALLRKQPGLSSVVVDVDNVCRVGRAIAAENGFEERITYLAADFSVAALPNGFDMAVLCDVGSFNENLFRRIHSVLNTSGFLVVVDKFALRSTSAPPSRLSSAFLHSLEHPTQAPDFTTTKVAHGRLERAGFRDISSIPVPHEDDLPWNLDWTLLVARKRTSHA